MSSYQNKKKYRKLKAKQKARDKKVVRRREALREEAKVKKQIERMQWDARDKTAPYRKPKEEDA